jgi:hypothetical protein
MGNYFRGSSNEETPVAPEYMQKLWKTMKELTNDHMKYKTVYEELIAKHMTELFVNVPFRFASARKGHIYFTPAIFTTGSDLFFMATDVVDAQLIVNVSPPTGKWLIENPTGKWLIENISAESFSFGFLDPTIICRANHLDDISTKNTRFLIKCKLPPDFEALKIKASHIHTKQMQFVANVLYSMGILPRVISHLIVSY